MEWYFILIIVLGTLSVILAVCYWLYKSNFPLSPTGNISEKIVSIKNRIANVYVYSKGVDRVVVDAGFSSKGMKKELMKMEIAPEEITDVFITHADPDHIGGLSLFNNAKIYYGEGSRVQQQGNYKFMVNNELILVGAIKIQAISTPGHRVGHTVYLIDNEYLFTGDLLRLKAGKVRPFFKFISADFPQLLESIRKVAKLENVKMLLTAHSGYTTEFDKAMEQWKI